MTVPRGRGKLSAAPVSFGPILQAILRPIIGKAGSIVEGVKGPSEGELFYRGFVDLCG